MNALVKWLNLIVEKTAVLRRPAGVVVAGVVILMIIIAAAWLVPWRIAPNMSPVFDESTPPADVASAKEMLQSRRIAHHFDAGRLFVPADMVDEVRAMLASDGVSPSETVAGLERLAEQNDIFLTRAQNDKRWLAAKMGVLSQLISRFPSVHSATVILEPGSPRTLGSPGVAPTAAVKVTLREAQRMTPKLVGAIADLVAGSVTGMCSQDVHIVDNSGESYRIAQDGTQARAGGLDDIRDVEAHYAGKIRAGLNYINKAVVGVNVADDGNEGRRLSASVAVPRSYLLAVYHAAGGAEGRVSDEHLRRVAEEQLPKIQQAVMRMIGAVDPADVKVDWYYDALVEAGTSTVATSVKAAETTGWLRRNTRAIGGGLIFAGLLLGGVLITHHRKARPVDISPQHDDSQADNSETVLQTVPQQIASAGSELEAIGDDKPFAFLAAISGRQLAEMLHEERSQTIALVLGHVGSDKAAVVLGALGRDRQAEVIHRLTTMQPVDEQVLREVDRGLAMRITEMTDRQPETSAGLQKATEILKHAGYHTERSVLSALKGREPTLAEGLGDRVFAFEDISRLSVQQIRGTLEMIESDELAVAMRTAGRDVRKRIFSALSSRAARRVRGEMERIGPVRLSDVETAQRRVVEAIRSMQNGRYVGRARTANPQNTA